MAKDPASRASELWREIRAIDGRAQRLALSVFEDPSRREPVAGEAELLSARLLEAVAELERIDPESARRAKRTLSEAILDLDDERARSHHASLRPGSRMRHALAAAGERTVKALAAMGSGAVDALLEVLSPKAGDDDRARAAGAVEGLDPSGGLRTFAERLRRKECGIRVAADGVRRVDELAAGGVRVLISD